MKKIKYLVKSSLKTRGWTDAIIARFLPTPDEERENPHYKSGPPMKLYSLKRVARIEKTKRFLAMKTAAEPRKKSAKKVADGKRWTLNAYVAGLDIKIPKMELAELARKACESYNALDRSLDHELHEAAPALGTNPTDDPFLCRIMVNHLRHCLSPYEIELEKIAGKVGADEARLALKLRILEAIAEAYRDLSAECANQETRAHESI